MSQIFVNLPTLDLERAKAFYSALGTQIVPEFSDDNAACVKWDDAIFFMILAKEYLQTFTDKPIADPHSVAQVMTALSRESRADVDAMRTAILEAGGGENRPPTDHGFMYGISMTDPDGNILEFMWMDPAAAEAGPEAFAQTEATADQPL
ncbi:MULTISPECIES: VOC family protein [unclassified Brevibacterium]|uniref:VOC family protein n=1 Tax=unclassified Brevibacterium TaxID=2614124 RepID=UPI0010F95DCF|nr:MULTISPECIES: VOC family protein [unclassified Brevibacterium]MCM1010979.1 VOC family protein [Brevibacterium sp. XM4083]